MRDQRLAARVQRPEFDFAVARNDFEGGRVEPMSQRE